MEQHAITLKLAGLNELHKTIELTLQTADAGCRIKIIIGQNLVLGNTQCKEVHKIKLSHLGNIYNCVIFFIEFLYILCSFV